MSTDQTTIERLDDTTLTITRPHGNITTWTFRAECEAIDPDDLRPDDTDTYRVTVLREVEEGMPGGGIRGEHTDMDEPTLVAGPLTAEELHAMAVEATDEALANFDHEVN